jgi:hypothetical protein
MRKSLLPMAVLLSLLMTTVAPSFAGETGIAGIHAWVRVGKKTCINKDHYHFGDGQAAKRSDAEKKAVENWEGFTAIDYGTDWMRYSLAESKKMTCEKSGSGWKCTAAARACKISKRKK